MNWLELLGAAFIAMLAILIFIGIWLQVTGGLSLFDEPPDEDDSDPYDRAEREKERLLANANRELERRPLLNS